MGDGCTGYTYRLLNVVNILSLLPRNLSDIHSDHGPRTYTPRHSARCCSAMTKIVYIGLAVTNNLLSVLGALVNTGPLSQRIRRNSAIADKPAQRVYRSVKVTKHNTIPYLRYSFLLCICNFVFETRRFYDIPLQKCRDLEIRVRGHL